MTGATTFNQACETLEEVLRSGMRSDILDYFCTARSVTDALTRMRSALRAHSFKTRKKQIQLSHLIHSLDARTRDDGFHVLIDWDGKANCWLNEMIPIDVLDYFARGSDPVPIGHRERQCLSILLDYYFLYVVALLAMRVTDEGDPPDNVTRVNRLIVDLQGTAGSGQQNVDDIATLILIATSHFEPDESAYTRLIDRIRNQWSDSQQLNWAAMQAAVLGSHLRHGFQDLYKRDIGLMRADNTSDYPCLCVALLTLMRSYARIQKSGGDAVEKDRAVEGLLNGLTPDPRAFLAKAPGSLGNYAADHDEFRALFKKYETDLFKDFEALRPSENKYSPLAFSFNFPHNLLKGMVVDALFKATPSAIPVNQLLSDLPKQQDGRQELARTLMAYARQVPDQVGGRSVPVICYDPAVGLRTFVKTTALLRELSAALPPSFN